MQPQGCEVPTTHFSPSPDDDDDDDGDDESTENDNEDGNNGGNGSDDDDDNGAFHSAKLYFERLENLKTCPASEEWQPRSKSALYRLNLQPTGVFTLHTTRGGTLANWQLSWLH